MLSKSSIYPALRTCQQSAVDAAFLYLENPSPDGSFLACLPTGAGKTGVIATIAQTCLAEKVLVISQRRAVCEQLNTEISGRFFETIFRHRPNGLKTTKRLKTTWSAAAIYVATFQKLTKLSSLELDSLCSEIELVIVDEGHSEPAPIWSQITRRFDKPKIIVTATPYRNDLYQFDISPEHTYAYTFTQAVQDEVLVSPELEVIEGQRFIAKLQSFLGEDQTTKAIIKCRSLDEIKKYQSLIRAADITSLAIHERLPNNRIAGETKSVPTNLSQSDWRVLIHQKKLDEGVDIPSAKALFLTYGISTGRELVQTVGRVVRRYREKTACVYSFDNGNNKLWDNYLNFDEYISDPSAWQRFLLSLDTHALLASYQSLFPEWTYYGREFKSRFDLASFQPEDDLRLPLASFCFLHVRPDFSLSALADTLYWRYQFDGDLAKVFNPSCKMSIVLSIQFDSSRYLAHQLFFEPHLEVVVAAKIGDYVAVFDSRSVNHANDEELATRHAIPVGKLLNLAARSAKVKTREAHSVAVDSANNRPDRVALAGNNLDNISATQQHRSYAISTLRVDNINQSEQRESGYYIGVGSGRISDQVKRNFTLRDIRDWLTEIASVLDESYRVNSQLLSSYALPSDSLPTGNAVSALFDLNSDETSAYELSVDGRLKTIPADYVYFERTNSQLTYAGFLNIQVDIDKENSALRFFSDSRIEFTNRDSPPFTEWLNEQPVKVLFDDAISYSNGNFYRVTFPTEEGVELSETKIGGAIIPVAELNSPGLSEKAIPPNHGFDTAQLYDEFFENSIFRLVDRVSNNNFPLALNLSDGLRQMCDEIAGCDLAMCTDMGSEPADFILSSRRKVSFVHIKCGSTVHPRSSAGALAEVGSQAFKNLEQAISRDHLLQAGNESRLSDPWPSAGNIHRLEDRVRRFEGKEISHWRASNSTSRNEVARLAWSEIRFRCSSSAYQKEVWLVLGNSFSKADFMEQMALGRDARPETLQAFQLIDQWMTIAQTYDTSLRIFCSP